MMEFFGAINNFVLSIGGFLFDWMLMMGQSMSVVVIGLVTSAILTFIRPWTTNQDLLGRCMADKKVIKRRLAEAKARKAKAKEDGDAEALAAVKEEINNLRMVVGKIGMKQSAQEGKPLLFALLPVILVFVWASDRLAYVPASEGEQVKVTAYFSTSAKDRIAYILPQDGLSEANGEWMKRILLQEVKENQVADCEAVWTLTAKARPDKPYVLKIQYDDVFYEKELLVGSKTNSPPLEMYNEESLKVVKLGLTELKPFGFIPNLPLGMPGTYIPAWMLVYLLVTIPFVFGLKGIFKIQ